MNEDDIFKLHDALLTIQNVCKNVRKNRGGCCNMGCPFCSIVNTDQLECAFTKSKKPNEWKVKAPPPLEWDPIG